MDSVAFKIFGIDIQWYGVIITFAVMLGTFLAFREADRVGVKEDDLTDMLLYAIPLSIVGARLYYVIFTFDDYKDNLIEIINIRGGGLAIHGAILTATLVAVIFAKKRNLNFWMLADIAAPSLILGQAIGRWGNYINQEAHGGPTNLPWGIMVNGVKVHPTFLYESIANLIIFFFLIYYRKESQKKPGEIFLIYIMGYSFVRYWIEGLRTDSLMIGPVRMAQLISIAMIIVGFIFFKKIRNK